MQDAQPVMDSMMSIIGSQHFRVAREAITMKGVVGGMMGLQTTVIFTLNNQDAGH